MWSNNSNVPDALNTLKTPEAKQQLLSLAKEAMEHRVKSGSSFSVSPDHYPENLQTKGCSFVTLHKNGQLRGCIGALEPYQPLIMDIVEHAQAAAISDPRFPPVTEDELQQLDIEISILTPQIELAVTSEQELLKELQPHKDGLTISDGIHRATFLPAVWEQLPNPESFLKHLKRKAGLAEHQWPEGMRCWRYHTIMIK